MAAGKKMGSALSELHNTELEDVLVLPKGTKFDYLAEGAANIVFQITLPQAKSDGIEQERNIDRAPFSQVLIRLRKDLDTTIMCAEAQQNWSRHIAPLFANEELVNQRLVQIGTMTVSQLNSSLREWQSDLDSPRARKRGGVLLADDPHGLLVTDMTPRPSQCLVEFKPKWLLQSPSAPPGSKRCRQCAKEAQLNADRMKQGLPCQPSFCPLDLVSTQENEIDHVANLLLTALKKDKDVSIDSFATWLRTTLLLRKLREWQKTLDPKGVVDLTQSGVELLAAMTLRDCTVFILFSTDSRTATKLIDARLGDLDLKSPLKRPSWKTAEDKLIEDGWYTCTEAATEKQPNHCQLGRRVDKNTQQRRFD